MNKRLFARSAIGAAILLTAVQAWAGPPLICRKIEIGLSKSLPWKDNGQWNGTDAAYDVAHLGEDTLHLLTPGAPVSLRMETLRRAALYAAREPRLADELAARLLARTADAEAAGRSDANAWFDAGYFLETVRQAALLYRENMLPAGQREAWKLREDRPVDGGAWVRKAIRLGGKDMEQAAATIDAVHRSYLAAK